MRRILTTSIACDLRSRMPNLFPSKSSIVGASVSDSRVWTMSASRMRVGEMFPPDIWVRGGSLARCYWNRPDITAERMRAGWFFTGDNYFADADGYF